MMMKFDRFFKIWITIFLLVLTWSVIHPKEYFTWFLETFPALIGFGILLATYNRFRLTTLCYSLILIHASILFVGGHYTYAEVPFFNWVRDTFHQTRNNYDKVGHFAQGFVPAIIAREVMIRKGVVHSRKWLAFIVVCICLAISATYEFVEWFVALGTGASADAFLGTQGDIWDTQSDMFFALIGAIVSLIVLAKIHDRQIASVRAVES